MNSAPLTIWCNYYFPEPVLAELRRQLTGHRLVLSPSIQKSNLVVGGSDPLLNDADIALGQPDVKQAMELPRLRWVHLTSAGYTRYDRDDIRQALRKRGAVMTNSSEVYAEPCAQHLLAMMMAMARRLPQCMADQLGPQSWHAAEHRARCQLLLGQSVLILGLGSIGSRLVELLQPFKMKITAVRRRPSGNELCQVVATEKADELLPLADHVVNILPANAQTERFVDARRIGLMKPTAILYNIGRGTTVDQPALLAALQNRKIAGAYLDVSEPEPVPPGDPLWTAPNCFITPHTAGGHIDEFERLARHFKENLDRFTSGKELRDQII
jgi:phosphoglycerate dehydrogenase-like enzyme